MCVALCACTDATPSRPPPPPAPVVVLSPPPPPPSFRRDVLPTIVEHCASAEGCHGDAPTDSVLLDLRAPAAYSELVGHAATARPGALRVAPGDPAASFLLDKLGGALGPREGKAMPLDADTGVPIEPSPLPAGYVDDVLRPWILAGAADD